jgi:hypothetical protein
MSSTYTWTVDSMTTFTDTANNIANVVNSVYYRVNDTDSDSGISVGMSDNVRIEYNPNDPFIQYANLTPNTVISWVQQTLGANIVSQIQSNLDAEIQTILNPPIVILPPPWS